MSALNMDSGEGLKVSDRLKTSKLTTLPVETLVHIASFVRSPMNVSPRGLTSS